MGLRIKKGAEIFAYGQGANSFTDQSELSQPILEHLKTRFPDDIEEGKPAKVVASEEVAPVLDARLPESGIVQQEIVTAPGQLPSDVKHLDLIKPAESVSPASDVKPAIVKELKPKGKKK